MTSDTHLGHQSTENMTDQHGHAEHSPAATERIPVQIYRQSAEANRAVAQQIADLIRQRAAEGRNCVLGLATGSTPGRRLRRARPPAPRRRPLVRQRHHVQPRRILPDAAGRAAKLRPLHARAPVRPRRHRARQLARPRRHASPIEQVADYCRWYEEQIAEAGGIDIQLLGIGRTGHIGFNEPGSGSESRTRLITLDRVTRIDAASDFFGEENVPRRAITMGVGTILEARQVIMLAFGEHKANDRRRRRSRRRVNPSIAASFLQEHPNAPVVARRSGRRRAHAHAARRGSLGTRRLGRHDASARPSSGSPASSTSRSSSSPTRTTTRTACRICSPSTARRTTSTSRSSAICKRRSPAGPAASRPTPSSPATARPPRDDIFPKRVLVFSPHPDDDVISMGGTLIRLVDQGHEVHVAYQTSGNIAVFDDDAIRFADFVAEFNRHFDVSPERTGRARSARRRVPPQQAAGPGRQPRSADDQEADPPRRSPRGRPLLRHPGRAGSTSWTCRSTKRAASRRSRSARRTSA